jgi:hypothetical protein
MSPGITLATAAYTTPFGVPPGQEVWSIVVRTIIGDMQSCARVCAQQSNKKKYQGEQ